MLEVPRSPDAEAAILGAVISSPDVLPKVATLTVDDFTDEVHRTIWQAMLDLLKAGKSPEPLLLKEEARGKLTLSDILKLKERACFPASIEHYAGILRKKEHGRRLHHAITRAQAAFADGLDYEEIEQEVITSLARRSAGTGTTSAADVLDVEKLLGRKYLQPYVGLGINDLDMATGGIRAGEVCILAARTSVGKSMLAIISALACIGVCWNVLYWSGEMPREQIVKRILAYQSGVALKKFRDCTFNDYDKRDIRAAHAEVKDYLKYLRIDTEANTPGKLQQLVRLEQLAGRGEYLIIDHAGRLTTDCTYRSDYSRMSEVANRLKDLAINLNIPVLALWQLNRGAEGQKPTLADLRDTGQAEEVADTVILLSRDKKEKPEASLVKVEVAKARDSGELTEMDIPWLELIRRVGPKEKVTRKVVV